MYTKEKTIIRLIEINDRIYNTQKEAFDKINQTLNNFLKRNLFFRTFFWKKEDYLIQQMRYHTHICNRISRTHIELLKELSILKKD